MDLSNNGKVAAKDFIENETAFHLGDLVTEQSHPVTMDLSEKIKKSTREGLELLMEVDRDIIPLAQKAIHDAEFDYLVESIIKTVHAGGRVIFSSCGASGRLAIILESMWRQYWEGEAYENQVLSIMTGGERALIRAVENFEDYQSFGRRQAQEASVSSNDMIIALTEGGEISSVIGTMKEATERGARVVMLYNNPRELLIEKFQRSYDVLTHPGIVSMELTTGPMALAGSTRMQATTIGLLLMGVALEEAFLKIKGDKLNDRHYYIESFITLLSQFRNDDAMKGLVELTDLETEVYDNKGRITYLADHYLLDIFSDTTERTPTFMIPPFRVAGDNNSPAPWAFAKDPIRSSNDAWTNMLKRPPRGLDWKSEDYMAMSAGQGIIDQPPGLETSDILSYPIGNEKDLSRSRGLEDCYIPVLVNEEYSSSAWPGVEDLIGSARKKVLNIGNRYAGNNTDMNIRLDIPHTEVNLFEHLIVKLIFNTISTATMAKLGRIRGNWMIQVDATNKKLIDRASRIIQHFSGLSYEEACYELFYTMALPDIDRTEFKESYVSQTLGRIGTTE